MFETMKRQLARALAEGPYLNGGFCLIGQDGREQVHLAGSEHPPHRDRTPVPLTDPGKRMRMASVSKAITARAACEMAVAGALDLDAKVAALLDWREAPEVVAGVTMRMLLNHTSGLTDHAGYIFERPMSPTEFVTANADRISGGHQPGEWFKYANLNYVLAGAVLEAVAGKRFDQIVRERVLRPAGIHGGFNWGGVPVSERTRRLPIYQRFGARLERQTEIEKAAWEADIVWGAGRGFSFDACVPVRDALLHSPHAGMRMNVCEAARLARLLGEGSPAARLQRTTTWKFDPAAPNGTDCDGLYGEIGLGLMIYRDDPRIAGPLVGHAGHALGFTGGVWFNERTGVAFGLFLTGSADLTEGLDDEVFFAPEELRFLQLLSFSGQVG